MERAGQSKCANCNKTDVLGQWRHLTRYFGLSGRNANVFAEALNELVDKVKQQLRDDSE